MSMQQWALPKRRDLIRQLHGSGVANYHHQMVFQGRLQTFSVYIVEIWFPCYRLSNGRTQSRQRELVASENLPDEFFSVDPDSTLALGRQEEILREMVVNSELMSILKRDPQTQPLILDADGYVINGNRRLCAMRMLLRENEQTYARFGSIQVVLLPPCADGDIADLEARLQIVPEGRADYTWVDEAMMYRRGRQQGWTDDHLADLYDKAPPVIRETIAMLDDAEQYLSDRGRPSHYSLVIKKEYAFRKLQKFRLQCSDDEAKKHFFTSVCYVMMDDPDAAEKRLYERIPDAFKFLDRLRETLRAELPPVADPPAGSIPDGGGLDLLGGLLTGQLADTAKRLRAPENQQKARELIRDTLEEMRDQERERRDEQYCLRSIQQAHTKLQSALSALEPSAATEGIEESLANIEQSVVGIRGWLSAHITHRPS